MKKVILLGGLSILYFAGALWADKTGVGTERGQDRTGSPVGSAQQCGQCHSGGNFGASISIRLKDTSGTVVTEYLGGQTYTYEVELSGSSPKFGFQSVALLSNNTTAGMLTAQSSNAKVITMNSRKYAEHTAASLSNLFVMNWTAPNPGSGTVKFYAAGNCVNANNASSGDQAAAATSLTITESAFSGVDEEETESILVYPNPAESIVNVTIPAGKKVSVRILDATGKLIESRADVENQFSFDMSGYEKGIYIVSVSGDLEMTKKFIH